MCRLPDCRVVLRAQQCCIFELGQYGFRDDMSRNQQSLGSESGLHVHEDEHWEA